MTAEGGDGKRKKCIDKPKAWLPGDLVVRLFHFIIFFCLFALSTAVLYILLPQIVKEYIGNDEDEDETKDCIDDNDDTDYFYSVYCVREVPPEHDDVSSDDLILLEHFVEKKHGGEMVYRPTKIYQSYSANLLTSVDPSFFELNGKLTNKVRVSVKFDLEAFLQRHDRDESTVEEEAKSEKKEDGPLPAVAKTPAINPLSINEVLSNCADFKNCKSMIEELLESEGHMVKLSSKFHAECAGLGIEYCFGRAKYYFRKYNRHSKAGLLEVSRDSLGKINIPLALTRKYARKCRDYMRAYRQGALKDGAKEKVKTYKCHRCALDFASTFIQDDLQVYQTHPPATQL